MWSARRAPAELDALCLDAIARFKRPKDYVFVDALPKNNYGKILKTELRAMDAAKGEPTHERDRTQNDRRALPALRQADRSGVQAVLLQALRRHRSQPLAFRASMRCRRQRTKTRTASVRPKATKASDHERASHRLARPAVRDAQARRHPPGRLRAGRRPFAADRALPRRRRHPRRRAHHRGGGRGAGGRRLARRRARGAADAVERARQLRQHALARAQLPLSAADADHHARRVGGVQSLAGADGLDRRSGAQAMRGGGLPRDQAGGGRGRGRARRAAGCSATSASAR